MHRNRSLAASAAGAGLLALAAAPLAAQAGAARLREGGGRTLRIVEPPLAANQEGGGFGPRDLLLRVDEPAQGADLDGDGDAQDLGVLHHVDLDTGVATNFGVAGLFPAGPIDGRAALLSASEPEGGVDWNGDGDRADGVMLHWSLAAGIASSGLSGAWSTLVDGVAVFAVSEAGEGRDLDGDGDLADWVLHAWRVGAAPPRNLGLALEFRNNRAALAAGDGMVLFGALEAGAGDLDGDGDALDSVLHAYDVALDSVTNLGLALAPLGLLRSGPTVTASGTVAAFLVSEAAQGALDRNGDGDALDFVVHVFDPALGIANLRCAVRQTSWYPGRYSEVMRIEGDAVLFSASEADQGARDLNGDGDATDLVLHLHVRGTPGARNLGAPGGFLQASEQVVAYPRHEDLEGSDLNGDGDQLDSVVELRRFDRPAPTSIALAVRTDGPALWGGLPGDPSIVGAHGHFVYAIVDEDEQGETDLNADGDATDDVLLLLDTRDLSLAAAPLAVDSSSLGEPRFARGELTLAVDEFAQGGRDLNGDGDLLDEVIHVVPLDGGPVLDTGMCVQAGFPAALTPAGRARRFLRREASEGRDLNGDGDLTDSAVGVLVVAPGVR